MSKQLILNLLLTMVIASASLPVNLTLFEAVQSNGTLDVLEIRALSCIASSHPELINYIVLDIYDDSAPNSTDYGYFVTLRSGNVSILAAVSFHSNRTNFFVSFTQLNAANTNQTLSMENGSGSGSNANNSSSDSLKPPLQKLKDTQNPAPPASNQTGSHVLGGYQLMPNLADAKLNIALLYLLQLHPNLANYKLQYVEYQVITGINYVLFYSGLDQITNLTAKVYVDLNGTPYLTAFKVTCAVISSQCNNNISSDIFHGTEQVLYIHPQLRSYRLLSIEIEDSNPNFLIFMATFQNEKLMMRALAEVKMGKMTEVLSFYSYLYS